MVKLSRSKIDLFLECPRCFWNAIPYKCKEIDTWRQNFTGIQFYHEPTGFLVFGAVDDVWINPQGELIVVDYKAGFPLISSLSPRKETAPG